MAVLTPYSTVFVLYQKCWKPFGFQFFFCLLQHNSTLQKVFECESTWRVKINLAVIFYWRLNLFFLPGISVQLPISGSCLLRCCIRWLLARMPFDAVLLRVCRRADGLPNGRPLVFARKQSHQVLRLRSCLLGATLKDEELHVSGWVQGLQLPDSLLHQSIRPFCIRLLALAIAPHRLVSRWSTMAGSRTIACGLNWFWCWGSWFNILGVNSNGMGLDFSSVWLIWTEFRCKNKKRM